MSKIFISAGHFNNDPGANSALGTKEANEMSQTRDLIVAELKARGLTEGADFFSVPDTIDLSPTIAWINARAVAGDVALEIHGNSNGGRARGTECFFVDGNSARERDAKLLLNALLQQVPQLTNRGAKRDTLSNPGRLGFCRQLSVPSLLLELCFIDNLQDINLLHAKRPQFAKGIVNGLIAWSGISATGTVTVTGTFPIIDIELNGRLFADKGILVNDNAFIPIDLAGLLGINLTSATNVRRESQGGVVYVKAVDLQQFNVSVSWNASPPAVMLNTALVAVETDQIVSQGIAIANQLKTFLEANNSGDFVNRFLDIAKLYIEEAKKEGVNHDIAFCQMCLETGYLKFGGDVDPSQNNFCGLGAVGGGAAGASFPDSRTGVKAHIQHLKAYASSEDILVPPIVDPRFGLVTRGLAPKVKDLSQKWATNEDYGDRILAIMRRLYESTDIDSIHNGDAESHSIAITSPSSGTTFDLNETFAVKGTATTGVVKVSLSSPFGGNIFPLATANVTGGIWDADVVFQTGGNREIIATALGNSDNPLDFDPAEVNVVIQGNLARPVVGGFVTSDFGFRNGRQHRGTDIGHRNRAGTPIHAITDGTVNFVQTGCSAGNHSCGGGFGNHVDIRHPSLGFLSRYAHLKTVSVTTGATVTKGQVIGTMGETGHAFGPHLHIEIRRSSDNVALDPETIIIPMV